MVFLGLRRKPRLPGVPDALSGWCGPSMRLGLAQAPQPWVCSELTGPADPDAVGGVSWTTVADGFDAPLT